MKMALEEGEGGELTQGVGVGSANRVGEGRVRRCAESRAFCIQELAIGNL